MAKSKNWLRHARRMDSTKVDFENEAEDVEEVEVDNTPHRKVKGRQPTAFVPKAPSHSAVSASVIFGRKLVNVKQQGEETGPFGA